ncbi:MAG TPA: response regulator [Gammaproteobacteria bacterium]|jgi:two-component system response regulator FixJ|nr:response regulator [Gammaproteobacteria bacterium]
MIRSQQTVFIVDDDDDVRDALNLLMKSIGLPSKEYASARSFLEDFDGERPGCLVLDIRMPDMTGLELQRELLQRKVHIPIVFITGHADVPMAVETMKGGAVDFIQKPFRDQDLIDCIHQALSKDAENRARLTKASDIQTRLEGLTSRERQVLDLVLAGKANKVIAAELGITDRTVEVHRARVMEKMKAGSLAHLVAMITSVKT